jgi:hypothetical protein
MKLTITIQMDNEAFDDGNEGRTEAARILRDVAKHLEQGDDGRRLMDSNGNHVGRFEITD